MTRAPSQLDIAGLSVSAQIDGARVPIVDDVSISVHSGEILGIAGESGSGKTVTAMAVMQLLKGTGLRIEIGSVRLNNEELVGLPERELRKLRGYRMSMVFQEPMTSLDPCFRVGELLVETLRSHTRMSRGEAKRRAIALLERVGIPDASDRARAYPFEMSGGQLQRVLIAMAIANSPAVLIADEPTTALDVTVQAQILDLIRELAESGLAVMLVTHDLALISEYADRLTVMYAGQVVESGPTDDVLARPAHPYTAGLIASIPSAHRRGALHSIPGRIPSSTGEVPGCRFAARCAFAQSECEQIIQLEPHAPDRSVRCVRHAGIHLEGYAP